MNPQVSWRGESGRTYTLETVPLGTQFNAVAGVYIFCTPLSNGNWAAMYVGETDDFASRLNSCEGSHHAWPLARVYGATHIGVLLVNGIFARQARLDIETDLRRGLKPPANRQSA